MNSTQKAVELNSLQRGDKTLQVRRALFASLVVITGVLVVIGLISVLSLDGFGWLDGLMVALFAATLPWTMIGFWNAVIGFILLRIYDSPAQATDPKSLRSTGKIEGRTALLMCVHNEDPDRVFKHLSQMAADLASGGMIDHFDIHLLSDSTDPQIAAEEKRRFAQWRKDLTYGHRLHYRRRMKNTDHKNGNLWEFLRRKEGSYDYFLLLDADSLMSADRIGQMVHALDRTWPT